MMWSAKTRSDSVNSSVPRHQKFNLRCRQMTVRQGARDRDEGSVLILAFIFLIMTSLVVVTLSSWASNGLSNAVHFQNASKDMYAADGAVQVAMTSTRYSYLTSNSEVCPGTPAPISINNLYVQVWCNTVDNVGAVITRQTTFTACLMPTSTSQLAGLCTLPDGTSVPQLLVAVANFDDTTQLSSLSNPYCSATNQSNCGLTMTIITWVSR